MADLIYRDFAIGDVVVLQAFLEGDKVIVNCIIKLVKNSQVKLSKFD